MSVPGALVRAHYRSTWNEIIRSSGFGGKAATIGMLALISFFVFLPGLFAIKIGLSLGGELAASSDAGVLRNWNGLQATFAAAFGLLGGFFIKPVFPFARFGRYPVKPLQLLLADLPATLFEVFPLLGVAGLVLTNAGLAVRMPRWAPIIALLALSGVVTLVSLTIISGALWRAITSRTAILVTLVAASVIGAYSAGLHGLRVLLKEWLPSVVAHLPGSRGYEGLIAVRQGDLAAGLSGIATAAASSAILLVVAAAVHQQRLVGEAEGERAARGEGARLRFRTPATGIARLFLRQLLASRAVRAQLLMPVLFTAPLAFVVSVFRRAVADGRVMPDDWVRLGRFADAAPWYVILPFLAVALNPQIWMNQFGWDRRGIRTLLMLPLDPGELLRGKLLGLAGFTGLQVAAGMVPLFFVRAPSMVEILEGAAVGAVALIVTTTAGQVVSIRFPRGIDGMSGLQVPLHLSWISGVTTIATAAELSGVWAIAELVVKGAGVVALVLSAGGAVLLYRAMLPRLVSLLCDERERMLGM